MAPPSPANAASVKSVVTLPAPIKVAPSKAAPKAIPKAAATKVAAANRRAGAAGASVRPARRQIFGRRTPRYTVTLASIDTMFVPLEPTAVQAERKRERAERWAAFRVLFAALIALVVIMILLAVGLVRLGADVSALMS